MKDKKGKSSKKRSKSTKKSSPKTAPSMPMEDKAWRARDDLRTLSQAEEIKQDSGRMNEVAKEGKKQLQALTKALQSHVDSNPVKKSKTEGMGGM